MRLKSSEMRASVRFLHGRNTGSHGRHLYKRGHDPDQEAEQATDSPAQDRVIGQPSRSGAYGAGQAERDKTQDGENIYLGQK